MTDETLEKVYLTIGTGERARERELQAARPPVNGEDEHVILGEKGLGRLSAMRLGDSLEVITATAADPKWNVLNINWNRLTSLSSSEPAMIDATRTLRGKASLIRFSRGSHQSSGLSEMSSQFHEEWSAVFGRFSIDMR